MTDKDGAMANSMGPRITPGLAGGGGGSRGRALAKEGPPQPAHGMSSLSGGAASSSSSTSGHRSGKSRARLTLHYVEGEQPMAELLRLAGGQGTDVIVEAVAPGSKAERAGIKAGWALATMNGRSEFTQLPGWQVRLLLEAPITLGFDPEPVTPQSMKCTEIRLTRVPDTLGIPPRAAVFGPRETGVLAEEVIFKPGSAPLWLSAWGDESLAGSAEVAAHHDLPKLYELRRPEAHAIVGHAIRGACDTVDQSVVAYEAEWFAQVAREGPQRSTSPSALCSIDCVAECLENEIVLDGRPAVKKSAGLGSSGGSVRAVGSRVPAGSLGSPGVGSPRSKGPVVGKRASGQTAGPSTAGQPAAATGDHGTLPPEARPSRSPGRTPAWPAANEAPRGRAEDRSPFRWLAPVLERVWGQSLSPCRSTSPCDNPQKPPARGSLSPGRGPSSGSPTRGPGRARAKSPQVKGATGDRPVGDADATPAEHSSLAGNTTAQTSTEPKNLAGSRSTPAFTDVIHFGGHDRKWLEGHILDPAARADVI